MNPRSSLGFINFDYFRPPEASLAMLVGCLYLQTCIDNPVLLHPLRRAFGN